MRFGLAFLVLCFLLAPLAAAQDTHSVTIHARESGCPEGKTFCFTMDGSLEELKAGDRVTFTLVNDGTTAHEMVVVPLAEADAEHKATKEDSSLGEIEEIEPGAQDTATFTIPSGGVYIWCALAGHEQLGMWMEIPADTTSKDSPLPVVWVLVGVAAALFLVRRRVADLFVPACLYLSVSKISPCRQ